MAVFIRLPISGIVKFLPRIVVLLFLLSFADGLTAQTVLENRLAVFRKPGTDPVVTRSAVLEIRDLVVVSIDPSGKRSAWQRDFFLGSAPFVPEGALTLVEKDIEKALGEFSALYAMDAKLLPLLAEEESKWKTNLEELRNLAEKETEAQKAEMESRVQVFMALEYDPSVTYEADHLASVINEGEALAILSPQRAGEILHAVEIWKKHVEHKKEGRSFINGEWVSPQEIRQRSDAAELQAMDHFSNSGVKLEMNAVTVPQTSLLIAVGLSVLTLIIVLYMFLNLASSGGALTFGGGLMLLAGVAILGIYGYYVYEFLKGPGSIAEVISIKEEATTLEHKPLKRILFLASKPEVFRVKQEDVEVELTDDMINASLQSSLKFVRTGSSELFDMERTAFACQLYGDRVVLMEEVVVFGKTLLIRHELMHRITEDSIAFNDFRVYLNGARLPGQLAAHFWMNLRKSLLGLLNSSGLPEIYQLADIEEGSLKLRLSKKPDIVNKGNFTE
ncbi:MAG: hypothetical protein ACFCUX_02540 [Candidatus Methylacidiphilales bacterium]